MAKRILTLIIEIENDFPKRPDWIWNSHKESKIYNAVKVNSIMEGPVAAYFEQEEDSIE